MGSSPKPRKSPPYSAQSDGTPIGEDGWPVVTDAPTVLVVELIELVLENLHSTPIGENVRVIGGNGLVHSAAGAIGRIDPADQGLVYSLGLRTGKLVQKSHSPPSAMVRLI